jgi:hypothetical protein
MLRTFKSRVVRRTFWLIKVVPTWKKFEKRCSRVKFIFIFIIIIIIIIIIESTS